MKIMQIINLKNSFKLSESDNIDSITRLNNTLKAVKELMDNDDSIKSLFNSQIIDKFIEIISEDLHNIGKEVSIDADKIRKFKDLLMSDTELNKIKVLEYIRRNANIIKRELKIFESCLAELFKFDINETDNRTISECIIC